MQEFDENKKLPEEESLDELIRSLNETLAHSDEMMRETPERERGQKPTFETPRRERRPVRKRERKRERGQKPAAPRRDSQPARRQGDADGIPAEKKMFIYLACVLLVSLLLAFSAWRVLDDVCGLTAPDESVAITIEEGDSVPAISAKLKREGVIRYRLLFDLYCVVARADRRVVPGTYELSKTFDYHALVNGMSGSGKRATVTLMIPEGYTCKDIFALMEEHGVCDAESLQRAAAEAEFDFRFLQDVPMDAPNRLEGCLFPDTYEFYVNDEPENVLKKMLQNTEKKLTDDLWEALDELNATLRRRKASAGFSQNEISTGDLRMYDVLTVASLIEKETAGTSENGVIASVIYNRLCSKAYPLLNIDAAIQYALQERKEQLTDADKLIESPYNTYKYPGLPVGPIANPGLLAIRGALFPQDTDYYFYALGTDGTHVFTRTYSEHLALLEELENG